jgi:hypothetical protein
MAAVNIKVAVKRVAINMVSIIKGAAIKCTTGKGVALKISNSPLPPFDAHSDPRLSHSTHFPDWKELLRSSDIDRPNPNLGEDPPVTLSLHESDGG